MKVKYGTHKCVLDFGSFVVKFPRLYKDPRLTWKSIISFYSEQLVYMILVAKMKEVICPSYFIPLVLILMQPKCDTNICMAYAKVPYDERYGDKRYLVSYTFGDYTKNKFFEMDLNPGNLGWYKGNLVKFDFRISF